MKALHVFSLIFVSLKIHQNFLFLFIITKFQFIPRYTTMKIKFRCNSLNGRIEIAPIEKIPTICCADTLCCLFSVDQRSGQVTFHHVTDKKRRTNDGNGINPETFNAKLFATLNASWFCKHDFVNETKQGDDEEEKVEDEKKDGWKTAGIEKKKKKEKKERKEDVKKKQLFHNSQSVGALYVVLKVDLLQR